MYILHLKEKLTLIYSYHPTINTHKQLAQALGLKSPKNISNWIYGKSGDHANTIPDTHRVKLPEVIDIPLKALNTEDLIQFEHYLVQRFVDIPIVPGDHNQRKAPSHSYSDQRFYPLYYLVATVLTVIGFAYFFSNTPGTPPYIADQYKSNKLKETIDFKAPKKQDSLLGKADLVFNKKPLVGMALIGGSLPFEIEIINQGHIASTATRVGFYLSNEKITSWNQLEPLIPIRSYYLKRLVPQQTVLNTPSLAIDHTLPTHIPHYLTLYIDYENTLDEGYLGEDNNILSLPIDISGPDAIVTQHSLRIDPTTSYPGSTLRISSSITNIGNSAITHKIETGYYLIKAARLKTNPTGFFDIDESQDMLLTSSESFPLPIAPVNRAYLSQRKATIPLAVAPGKYYIIPKADLLNNLFEALPHGELNNILAENARPIVILSPNNDRLLSLEAQ